MLVYYSVYGVGKADTFLSPLRPQGFEILKTFLDRKTKMLTYCSEHRVGTNDTFLSPVRPLEIKILKKKFFGPKNEKAHILFRAPR